LRRSSNRFSVPYGTENLFIRNAGRAKNVHGREVAAVRLVGPYGTKNLADSARKPLVFPKKESA
jgi:hypothetical protein